MFLIFSCSQQDSDVSISTIEVDVTSNAKLKLSDFFENFKMVSLQSDSVMAEIKRIRFDNNRIYISDVMNTMFVFSDSGSLLSYFDHRGGGPREYIGITDFVVDGDTITVLCRTSKRLLKYNISGEFLSEQKLEYYALAISPTVNDYNFLYCGYENAGNNSKLHRVRSGLPDSSYLFFDRNEANYMHNRYKDNFFQNKETIYFFELFNNIVYNSVDGGEIKPAYRIDYKDKTIPEDFFKRKFNNVMEFSEEYNKTSYAHGVYSFVEFDRFLMFGSSYLKKIKLSIFDRRESVSYTYSDIIDDVYLPGAVFPALLSYQADKHLFFKIDAYQVVEWRSMYFPAERFKEIVDATKEDDNPLLLVFDFKQ